MERQLYLLCDTAVAEFQRVFAEVVFRRHGKSGWNSAPPDNKGLFRIAEAERFTIVEWHDALLYRGGMVMDEVSRVLGGRPMLHLRTWASYWYYHFQVGSVAIDQFNTDPPDVNERYQSLVRAGFAGRPEIIARAFHVDLDDIRPYFRQWPKEQDDDGLWRFCISGYARPGDDAEFGDPDQVFDFLRALGGPRRSEIEWRPAWVTEPEREENKPLPPRKRTLRERIASKLPFRRRGGFKVWSAARGWREI